MFPCWWQQRHLEKTRPRSPSAYRSQRPYAAGRRTFWLDFLLGGLAAGRMEPAGLLVAAAAAVGTLAPAAAAGPVDSVNFVRGPNCERSKGAPTAGRALSSPVRGRDPPRDPLRCPFPADGGAASFGSFPASSSSPLPLPMSRDVARLSLTTSIDPAPTQPDSFDLLASKRNLSARFLMSFLLICAVDDASVNQPGFVPGRCRMQARSVPGKLFKLRETSIEGKHQHGSRTRHAWKGLERADTGVIAVRDDWLVDDHGATPWVSVAPGVMGIPGLCAVAAAAEMGVPTLCSIRTKAFVKTGVGLGFLTSAGQVSFALWGGGGARHYQVEKPWVCGTNA